MSNSGNTPIVGNTVESKNAKFSILFINGRYSGSDGYDKLRYNDTSDSGIPDIYICKIYEVQNPKKMIKPTYM